MQEANVRLLELRHTLPNLKALLLTLSSPASPPPLPPIFGSSAYVNSRSSSRAWNFPRQSSASSTVDGRDSLVNGVNTPSPLRLVGRGSVSSRPSMGQLRETESEPLDPEKEEGQESELELPRSVAAIRPFS